MLHKDYDRKGSVAKKTKDSGHEPQEAWRQDEPIGGKPPVVNWLWTLKLVCRQEFLGPGEEATGRAVQWGQFASWKDARNSPC
jgi:hypothetical protein